MNIYKAHNKKLYHSELNGSKLNRYLRLLCSRTASSKLGNVPNPLTTFFWTRITKGAMRRSCVVHKFINSG